MWCYYTGFLNLYTRPVSRKEAKENGWPRYFTGNPCVHGHITLRVTYRETCEVCAREINRRSDRNNLEVSKARKNKYKKDNSEKVSKKNAEYKKRNSGKVAATNKKREEAKRHRYVSWANDTLITEKYIESARLTKTTHIPHNVHHDIPLQGKLVSGLHVENNLVVITQSKNFSLGNTFDPWSHIEPIVDPLAKEQKINPPLHEMFPELG